MKYVYDCHYVVHVAKMTVPFPIRKDKHRFHATKDAAVPI